VSGQGWAALHERVERDHTYHRPCGCRIAKHTAIRDEARALAHQLVDRVPPGRELSLALTAIEEAVMWANAGIARGGCGEPGHE
jgi:hypothetical protein